MFGQRFCFVCHAPLTFSGACTNHLCKNNQEQEELSLPSPTFPPTSSRAGSASPHLDCHACGSPLCFKPVPASLPASDSFILVCLQPMCPEFNHQGALVSKASVRQKYICYNCNKSFLSRHQKEIHEISGCAKNINRWAQNRPYPSSTNEDKCYSCNTLFESRINKINHNCPNK